MNEGRAGLFLPHLPVEKGNAGLDGAVADQEAGEVPTVVLQVELALHPLREEFGVEVGGMVHRDQAVPAAVEEEVGRRVGIDVVDRRGQPVGLGLLGPGAADELHHQASIIELEEVARQAARQHGGQPGVVAAMGCGQGTAAAHHAEQADQVGAAGVADADDTVGVDTPRIGPVVDPGHGLLQVVELGGEAVGRGEAVGDVDRHVAAFGEPLGDLGHVVGTSPLPAASMHQQGRRAQPVVGGIREQDARLERLGPVGWGIGERRQAFDAVVGWFHVVQGFDLAVAVEVGGAAGQQQSQGEKQVSRPVSLCREIVVIHLSAPAVSG